jgi:hypothetical protein
MALDREPIFVAIFARLQAIPGVVTCSRKWRHFDDVPPMEQPAIFLTTGPEDCQPQRGMPPVWTLNPSIHVYCRNDADPTENAVPGVQLHALLKLIEAAFERTQAEASLANGPFSDSGADSYGTTLGGLVNHCYIKGQIVTDEGLLQNQALAIIPVEVLTTS